MQHTIDGTPARPPRILVLMAIYNGAKFLQAQLDSLVAQTDPDWDLLASDVGSTDDSRAILARARADARRLPPARAGEASGMTLAIRREGTENAPD